MADPVAIAALEKYMNYIATGLNNIINLFNPEIMILNNRLLTIYPNALPLLLSKLSSSISQPCKLLLSELGEKACVMGACALVIKNFLGVSKLSLSNSRS